MVRRASSASAVAALVALGAGCYAADREEFLAPLEDEEPPHLTVALGDGTLDEEGVAAVAPGGANARGMYLDAGEDDLVITVRAQADDGDDWTLEAITAPEEVFAGEMLRFEVVNPPHPELTLQGEARVRRIGKHGASPEGGGVTLTVDWCGRTIDGEADVEPLVLRASFTGPFSRRADPACGEDPDAN